MRRRILLVVVLVAAGVLATVGAAGAGAAARPDGAGPQRARPAVGQAAAASCHAESCVGKSPSGYGCTDDGYRVAGFVVTGTTVPEGARKPDVDLWYSPACEAAWGHYFSTLTNENRQVTVEWLAPYGGLANPADFLQIRTFEPGEFVTTMVAWNNSIRICAHPSGATGSTCTGWR
jgi:hypothetical protein